MAHRTDGTFKAFIIRLGNCDRRAKDRVRPVYAVFDLFRVPERRSLRHADPFALGVFITLFITGCLGSHPRTKMGLELRARSCHCQVLLC